VIESIRNMQNWWFVEAPEFIIVSNLDSAQRPMVSRMQSDIAVLRANVEALIPPRQPIHAVSVLRVFASSREYADYVPASMAWTGGMWMPAKKELVVKPIDWGREAERRAAFLSTIYHESFHQYIFYAFDMVDPSMWYNEGHGDYFAGAEIRGREVVIRENTWRVPPLLKAIEEKRVDLAALLRMAQPEFYGTSDEQRELNYALAWGLVYYLRKGTAIERRSPYASILATYEDALWTTRDDRQATVDAFGPVDMKALENDFITFWRSSAKRSRAEKNRPLRP
jgi:hypothetical protein